MAQAKTLTQVGSNVAYSVAGSKLTIVVDLDQVADAPAPGKKMRQVANSGGFSELPDVQVDGLNVRLNLYAGVYPAR
jgi:hypothetical protein